MKKILFVDDDRFFAHEYLAYLREHYLVVVCYDADTAVKALQADTEIVAAVVDVMMPPPPGFEHETNDGFTTGIWILQQCQEVVRGRNVVVLLFTNRGLNYVKEEIAFLNLNPRLCEISAKDSIDADDLPHTVGKLIARR